MESGRIERVAAIGALRAVGELGRIGAPDALAFVVHATTPSSATARRVLRTARLRRPA
jgi:hypothetical protein